MQPAAPRDPPRRRLELPGVTLSYTDEGEGPVVVGLSGLPGAHHHWRWLATPLFEWARFIRLELPGFGDARLAGPVRPLSLPARGELVARALEALELRDVGLVGHSMGGVVALEVAARHGSNVTSVALVATPGPTPHFPERWWRAAARLVAFERAQPLWVRLARSGFARFGLSTRDMRDEGALRTIVDVAATSFERHRENVGLVRQPVLHVWADDDALVPKRFHHALAAARHDWARLSFSGGGHDVQKFHGVELGAALRHHVATRGGSQVIHRLMQR